MIRIRPAYPTESDTLTALMRRSKAHWGYSQAFMQAAHDELTVTAADISLLPVFIGEVRGHVAGFYLLQPTDGSATLHLRDLFVDPDFIGMGYGKCLWDHAVSQARERGVTSLIFDADPNAVGFYDHMGAVQIGETASTVVSGWMLPQMRFTIS
jgi:GNAT superfamily N-acetyltransferase